MSNSRGPRLRRSPWIVSYWDKGRLIYHNYLSGIRVSAAPITITVLDFFSGWKQASGLSSRFPQLSPASIRRTVGSLTNLSFLETEGHGDPRSQAMQTWQDWSPAAAFFHFVTKDVKYVIDPKLDDRDVRKYIRRNPQPSFFKRYPDSPAIALPSCRLPASSEFLSVLHGRRTWREFSPANVTLTVLAQLLHLTWGVTGFMKVKFLGRLPLKTSPSAGARHPIEVYVVPLRIDSLPQGIYHYASDQHKLECVRKAPMKGRIARYLGGQTWYAEAAAVFIMTAVFPRNMWKYAYPRSYRSVLLDAGHLCQTFCLTATWLGLAPFCTAALADTLIEKDLGTDGITESVLYVAGVGVRP